MPKVIIDKEIRNICIICGKEVAGELHLRHGWLYYDKGGFGGVTHRHNTPEFYENRSRNQRNKPKAVEQALERLLLHPNDEEALQTLHEWRSKKLFELATDPKAGYNGIRAAEELLREFVGEPETLRPQIILNDQLRPRDNPPKDVVVHIVETPEPKRYQPPQHPEEGASPYDETDNELLEPKEEYVFEERSLGTILVTKNGLAWAGEEQDGRWFGNPWAMIGRGRG